MKQTNTKTCHPPRSRPPPRNPHKTEDEDENDDEEEPGEFLADYGFGVGAAPSVFSGAMNFRAMLIPMRIICNDGNDGLTAGLGAGRRKQNGPHFD